MGECDAEPVAVPRQVHCELETLRQMGTHDLLSPEALDAFEAYDFDAAREWVVDNPEQYVRAVHYGTEDETLARTSPDGD